MQKTVTFLMFCNAQYGRAKEAIELYISLFPDSAAGNIIYFGANDPMGKEGYVKHASFTLAGQEYMVVDNSMAHNFTFTPAVSIYVRCNSEEEIDRLFNQLSKDGQVMMPLNNYGFSKKFGWTADRFGVSWQLDLR